MEINVLNLLKTFKTSFVKRDKVIFLILTNNNVLRAIENIIFITDYYIRIPNIFAFQI